MKIALNAVTLLTLFLLSVGLSLGQTNKALLLFGGNDHKTFLGCLNCSSISSDSVCNSIGKYGSTIAADSIWNSIGHYGSSISSQSPWNTIANDAPVIVDTDGASYGYFSANTLHPNRTRIRWLVSILDYYEKTEDLDKTMGKMCED